MVGEGRGGGFGGKNFKDVGERGGGIFLTHYFCDFFPAATLHVLYVT